MKPGDLIEVVHNVTGGGKVRRAVRLGEIGMLIDTHYNSDLTRSHRLWLNVMIEGKIEAVNEGEIEVIDETG